jgi:predicted PurR-regulated permease PerM
MQGPTHPTERNPETTARSRRESWWQIYLPVLLASALGIVALVLIVRSGAAGTSAIADLSLILLSVPVLIVGLVVLVAFGFVVYGVSWLVRNLPPYAKTAQDAVDKVGEQIRAVMNGLAGGVIVARGVVAGLRSLLESDSVDGDRSPGSAPRD